MIGAANHVRDVHVDVIDHHAQLISGQSGRSQQHEIFHLLVLHVARTEDDILEVGYAGTGSEKSNGIRSPLALVFGALFWRVRAATVWGAALGLLVFRFRISFVLLLRRRIATGILCADAVTAIARAIGQYFFRGGTIQVRALRLKYRFAIPGDSQPAQAGENALYQFGLVALDVSILNAQQHRAALVLGK